MGEWAVTENGKIWIALQLFMDSEKKNQKCLQN